MARARSDAPSRADRPPRAAALALEAERGPCDVRSRASRASTRARRGGPIVVWVAPRCGMLRGSCAGTEVSDARGRSVRMHGRPDQALHPLRARAPARTRQHALAMPMAFREGLTRCAAGAAHRRPTLTVILTLPSRLHPPRPHPHPRPHRPMARAVGPRLTRCPTLALAPGGRRPRGRGRSTRRVLPRVVAARPHAGSALRRVTPATRRLRGPRAGTERESVDATTRCVGPRRSAAHARPRTRPTRTLRCGRCPGCAVLCCVAGARRLAPWRAVLGRSRARGLDIVRPAAVRRPSRRRAASAAASRAGALSGVALRWRCCGVSLPRRQLIV